MLNIYIKLYINNLTVSYLYLLQAIVYIAQHKITIVMGKAAIIL